jgi:glycerate kinase
MHIVAAPNAFKGSLSAVEAAEAMRRGILAANPRCRVSCVPVADGGDGLTEVMLQGMGGQRMETRVTGPRFEKVSAPFCLVRGKRLAVVEMARASGLALLPESQRNPMETTTYGTGELILSAVEHGATQIIVGIGGSATCDGGIGMAAALGYRFLDESGAALKPVGGQLNAVAAIDKSGVDPRLAGIRVAAACDVTNPLTGPEGAAQVFGPQKGASADQVDALDAGLANLARVIRRDMGVDIQELSGSGAAGGLGGGLHAFLGAELMPGIDLILDVVGLKSVLIGADLVLTAEGQIDDQTRFNKAPAGVARMARAAGVPCFAICGAVGEAIHTLHDIGIDAVFSICRGPLSLEKAMQNAPDLLARCTEQVVRAFVAGREGAIV